MAIEVKFNWTLVYLCRSKVMIWYCTPDGSNALSHISLHKHKKMNLKSNEYESIYSWQPTVCSQYLLGIVLWRKPFVQAWTSLVSPTTRSWVLARPLYTSGSSLVLELKIFTMLHDDTWSVRLLYNNLRNKRFRIIKRMRIRQKLSWIINK